jgi:hypothetical protein
MQVPGERPSATIRAGGGGREGYFFARADLEALRPGGRGRRVARLAAFSLIHGLTPTSITSVIGRAPDKRHLM